MALVGGNYGALIAKKSKKGPKGPDSVQTQPSHESKRAAGQGQPAARKEAKVLSLKESNAVQGKKDYKPPVQEEKKEAPKQKAEEPVAKKTTAEEKKEREKTDRHVPRSGKSPARGSKGDDAPGVIAADEAAAAADDPAAAAEARAASREAARLAKEEEDAKKQREEEERQITYDDYLKKQKEMAAQLPQAQKARTVDQKAFAKFAVVTKGTGADDALSGFGLKKEKEKVAPPPKPAGKAAKGKGPAKPEPKAAGKQKAKKMDMSELSFTVTDQAPKPRKGKGGGKGGGGGGPRGGPEWDKESKVDSDGTTRTKREFFTKYGGFAEWDRAQAQGAAAAAPAAPAEPEAETW
eukprot:Hpha_TRINITY_DN15131_c4_g2::TRINITY_DN15131_c4_g2_i2::g.128182::m.128182